MPCQCLGSFTPMTVGSPHLATERERERERERRERERERAREREGLGALRVTSPPSLNSHAHAPEPSGLNASPPASGWSPSSSSSPSATLNPTALNPKAGNPKPHHRSLKVRRRLLSKLHLVSHAANLRHQTGSVFWLDGLRALGCRV